MDSVNKPGPNSLSQSMWERCYWFAQTLSKLPPFSEGGIVQVMGACSEVTSFLIALREQASTSSVLQTKSCVANSSLGLMQG